jgi:hypothetical protein
VLALVVAGVALVLARGKPRGAPPNTSVAKVTTTTAKAVAPPPPVAAAVAGWRALPVPITAALVLPGPAGQFVVVGGQVGSGQSATGAFLVSTATGTLHLVANLVAGAGDTAGAVLRGRYYVFGGVSGGPGGTAGSLVQSFPVPGSAAFPVPGSATGAFPVSAIASGQLPAPRAGAGAVAVGPVAYLVGGYSGQAAAATVLKTADGSTFVPAARLAVPVRDAAVGALHGQVYIFGGARPVSSGHPPSGVTVTWEPVADIQHFDPATGEVTVVGHLPLPVSGAVAANLGGHLYVAGGETPLGLNSTIWGFEATRGAVVASGHLPVPVSGAGAAVVGSSAWLVGGARAGHPVGTVQVLHLR